MSSRNRRNKEGFNSTFVILVNNTSSKFTNKGDLFLKRDVINPSFGDSRVNSNTYQLWFLGCCIHKWIFFSLHMRSTNTWF